MPAAFKEQLGTHFMLTMGADHHARIYPESVWLALKEKLAAKDALDAFDKHRLHLLRLHNSCERISLDTTGTRITLPRWIQDWIDAQEKTPIIMIGNDDYIEVWSNTGWKAYSAGYTHDNVDDARIVVETGKLPDPKPPKEPQRT